MPRRSPTPAAFLISLSISLSATSIVYAQSPDLAHPPAPAAVVQVESGRLQGSEPAPGVRAYLGVPYAQPPIGPLRWRPPQPVDAWTGIRPALQHGNPCPQQKFGWNNGSAEHGNEDCLFLNVWAPAAGGRHPVMVYIHGGSNVAGSAAEELSNGLTLVPRGVVLVTLDYRLGIFGFMRTPALDAESGHQASGDYGLMDQIAALRWVQKNIAGFGGDPGNVTVFGQSAGSVDTGLLMCSPLARGLFTRALEESGQVLGLMPTATREESEEAWAPVAKALGPNLAAMRAASTEEVLKADAGAPKPPPFRFWGHREASVDGWVLTELPAATFARGGEAPVPLVIGSNVQEIVPRDQPADVTKQSMGDQLGAADVAKLEAIYANPGADPLLGNMGARWQTDRDFRCAVRQVAAWHAAHGFPTYVYQFDRPVPGKQYAEHSSELMFVFHYFPAHTETAADDAVSNELQEYWATFARTGSPAGAAGLPDWPRFSSPAGSYLHFEATSTTPVVAHDLGGGACEVLAGDNLPGSH
jgi:para-nitrobenzyl esterase